MKGSAVNRTYIGREGYSDLQVLVLRVGSLSFSVPPYAPFDIHLKSMLNYE